MIPAINPHTDISPEDFKKTLYALLGKIDCLYRLKLHGGEVLLHPHLDEIIEYANKQKKIKSIRIATNGTVIPSKRILKSLENSKVVVQISDYKLPEAKIEQLKSVLEGASVKYAFLENQKWRDMGDFAKRKKSRYSECSIKRCTSLFQGKIYLCSRAAMMKHFFQTEGQREGICVFTDTKIFRAQMKALYEGKMSDVCFFCDGDTCFAKEIEAGEQQ